MVQISNLPGLVRLFLCRHKERTRTGARRTGEGFAGYRRLRWMFLAGACEFLSPTSTLRRPYKREDSSVRTNCEPFG